MKVRKYQNHDYKEVLRMLSESMDYHMEIADPTIFKKSSDKLMSNYLRHMVAKAKRPKAILFVAEDDKKELVGFVYGEIPKYSLERTRVGKKCGVVHEIYVMEDQRMKGVATELIIEMEAITKELGCELIKLKDVHHKNESAIRLYKKLGYNVRVMEFAKLLTQS